MDKNPCLMVQVNRSNLSADETKTKDEIIEPARHLHKKVYEQQGHKQVRDRLASISKERRGECRFPLSFFVVAVLILAGRLPAQAEAPTVAAIERQIVAYLNQIERLSYPFTSDQNALDRVNNKLLAYMKQACQNRSLLSASLKKAADKGLMIVTSSDKRVRFYTWDTCADGAMHFYYSLVQYLAKDQIKCKVIYPEAHRKLEEGVFEPGSFILDVRTVQTKDNQTVYLVTDRSVASSEDFCNGISAYIVQKDQFVPFPFFQTSTKLLDSISYSLQRDFVDNSGEILFTPDKQKLLIPTVNKDGKVMGKFIVYRFNGYKFVFDKNARQ